MVSILESKTVVFPCSIGLVLKSMKKLTTHCFIVGKHVQRKKLSSLMSRLFKIALIIVTIPQVACTCKSVQEPM
jgi:hypothetical protein